MANVPNTVSTLNGNFKEVYADKIKQLVPDNVMLLNMVDFLPSDKALGNEYHQPVILGHEHGFSYGGTDGSAFALNDAIAGVVKDAKIQGYEYVLRTQISYAAASRAAASKAAFERSTKLIVANMIRSFAKRLEISMFYGQTPLATVGAGTTTTSLAIPAADWAAGVWVGSEQAEVELFDGSSNTLRGSAKINAVDLTARTLGLASAIAGAASGDTLYFKSAKIQGSAGHNDLKGLQSIIQESATLFNISTSSYSLWKGNTYSAGSADLSFEKIQEAIAVAVEKGLDEDVTCIVNHKTWAKLLTDQAALRMYDSSYSREVAENGSQSIKFHSQNGSVEIRPCTYVKESLAFVLPTKTLMRVGSTDITFKLPGQEYEDRFFRELESNAGFELRAYTDQALFCDTPGKLVLITNIVNS